MKRANGKKVVEPVVVPDLRRSVRTQLLAAEVMQEMHNEAVVTELVHDSPDFAAHHVATRLAASPAAAMVLARSGVE